MIRKHSFLMALAATLGLALVGCGNDDNGGGGTGGTGGGGGTGGTGGGGGGGMASVNIAHLAPDVPAAGDTAVDIVVVNDSGSNTVLVEGLEFGNANGSIGVEPGTYTLGIAAAGDPDNPVFTFEAEIGDGAILTVVAYADSAGAGVNVLVFNSTAEGLESNFARVLVGHGADSTTLTPVDVILAGDGNCPPPLIDNLTFGSVSEDIGDLEVELDPLPIAFDLEGDCTVSAGPLDADLTPDVVNILVAVFENEALAVYALVGDATGPLPTLPPTTP